MGGGERASESGRREREGLRLKGEGVSRFRQLKLSL